MKSSEGEGKDVEFHEIAAAAKAATAVTQSSVFHVTAHGQIESGEVI